MRAHVDWNWPISQEKYLKIDWSVKMLLHWLIMGSCRLNPSNELLVEFCTLNKDILCWWYSASQHFKAVHLAIIWMVILETAHATMHKGVLSSHSSLSPWSWVRWHSIQIPFYFYSILWPSQTLTVGLSHPPGSRLSTCSCQYYMYSEWPLEFAKWKKDARVLKGILIH